MPIRIHIGLLLMIEVVLFCTAGCTDGDAMGELGKQGLTLDYLGNTAFVVQTSSGREKNFGDENLLAAR